MDSLVKVFTDAGAAIFSIAALIYTILQLLKLFSKISDHMDAQTEALNALRTSIDKSALEGRCQFRNHENT